MKIGTLRHKITIQEPTESEDPVTGEIVTTWEDFAEVWAEVLPLVGREYWAAKTVNAETTGKIRIRYLADITPKMRIMLEDRIFNITGIVNVEEKNREMVLYYSEAV